MRQSLPATGREISVPPTSPSLSHLRGEFTITIFAGMIGGTCISLFEMQPASATGAMLQEAINFIREPRLGSVEYAAVNRQYQILALCQFSVMLATVAAGTGWGRLGRIYIAANPSPRLWMLGKICVPLVSSLALLALTLTLHTGERTLDEIQQTWICAMFALSIGLLWGIIPAEGVTTARSFLLKRAALGDMWALRQIMLFLFCVGFTGSLYQNINVTNPSLHLVGSVVVLLGLLDTGYMASDVYLNMPLPDSTLNPVKRWAPVVSTALAIFLSVLTVLYSNRLTDEQNARRNATNPVSLQGARLSMPAEY